MEKILIIGAILAIGLSTSGCGAIMRTFNPEAKTYLARIDGEAQFAESNAAKQVAVQTAKAKSESAVFEKAAEIKITGEALHTHPEYLRYLYVNNLASSKNQIIYIPTEAGLPILEAGRGQTHNISVEQR